MPKAITVIRKFRIILGRGFSARLQPGLQRWTIRAVQLAAFLLAAFFSFLLRFDFKIPAEYRANLVAALCCCAVAKVVAFHGFHLDREWWRYVSVSSMLRVVAGNITGSILGFLALLVFAPFGFVLTFCIVDFLLCFILTAGLRFGTRVVFEYSRVTDGNPRKRTLIYGAGNAGATLVREIQRDSGGAYDVIGFIDDAPQLVRRYIQGTKILGNGALLPGLVDEYGIETVLIALPSATSAQMCVILNLCHQAGVHCKTVPRLLEVIESHSLAAQIRDVAVEDLLGRHAVQLEEGEVRRKLNDEVVLVTGAAGSIGSELCHQIARFGPRAIVGYECAESPLFLLQRQIQENFPDVPFYAEIGDIRNPRRLSEVLELYRPSILYHAAAYKHVPMMEMHPFEAVENNIIGTWNVAVAAARYSVRDFVMISSDKAVRPTNVMGATKRVAELLIQALQNGGPRYVSVRFGNVLGSNGSVIPIFKQQIAARKPITVTHPEMTRYFMTIPEASQLVLQASTMGHGGEVFVLDMGAPVRIVDLARNLILLSGLRPGEDIAITFSGTRPGEKLYEELSHTEEEILPTPHPGIKVFGGSAPSGQPIEEVIETFRRLCVARDQVGLIRHMKGLVPEYDPSAHVLPRMFEEEPGHPHAEAAIA